MKTKQLPKCPECQEDMTFKRNKHWHDPFIYCKNLECKLANIGTKLSEVKRE